MSKRKWLSLLSLLLVASLWLTPVYEVSYAQEEPVAETEERDATGAGLVILLVGLGAILMVGAASSTRRSKQS